MFRNSNAYRRLWYYKRRRSKAIHTLIYIVSISVILSLLISYADKKLLPYLCENSQHKMRIVVSEIINQEVNSLLSENVKYSDLVIINRDKNNDIISVQTNVGKLNWLSSQIACDIQEKLLQAGKTEMNIPFGALTGTAIFSAYGPNLRVKVIPAGDVEVDARSEFSSAGINQTRHRIYMNVKINYGISVPMILKKQQLAAEIPVTETIIVGKVPAFYIENN